MAYIIMMTLGFYITWLSKC